MGFGHLVTYPADQKNRGVILAGMQTGGKGVQPLQAMRQPMLDQKLKRTIGDRRLATKTCLGQPVKHFVSAHRPMRFKQDLQCAPADRRQPCTLLPQTFLGFSQCPRLAKRMIMRGESVALIRFMPQFVTLLQFD